MKFLIFLTFFVYVSSSSLYSSVNCSPDVVRVCCFSTSPGEYSPNCYNCPTTVYGNALMACVNTTEMPRNITFKQANCMEKNCLINYPSPPDNGLAKYTDLANLISQFFGRTARSVDAVQHKRKRAADNVVKEVKTFVTSLGNVEFAEPEYM